MTADVLMGRMMDPPGEVRRMVPKEIIVMGATFLGPEAMGSEPQRRNSALRGSTACPQAGTGHVGQSSRASGTCSGPMSEFTSAGSCFLSEDRWTCPLGVASRVETGEVRPVLQG